MGDLADSLASSWQPVLLPHEARRVALGGILAAAGVASTLSIITLTYVAASRAAYAALVLPFPAGAWLMGAGLLRADTWQPAVAPLRRVIRTHRVVEGAWAALGVIGGLQPLAPHACATGSPFPLPWYSCKDVAAPLPAVAVVLTPVQKT